MPENCYFVSILAPKHSSPFLPIHIYEITIAFLSLLMHLGHFVGSNGATAFNE